MTSPRPLSELRLGAVLLGAGRSERMGHPKLLLPWAGTTVLGHLLRQWQELGATQIAVVCSPHLVEMDRELDKLGHPADQRIYNPNPDQGMFSSIQCAARWTGWQPTLTHWAVILGDQPHLHRDTLRELLDFGAGHPGCVCQPSWAGRHRHPVLLPRTVWGDLAGSTAQTLKDFLGSYCIAGYPATDAGLGIDLDYPEQYEHALRHFGGAA